MPVVKYRASTLFNIGSYADGYAPAEKGAKNTKILRHSLAVFALKRDSSKGVE